MSESLFATVLASSVHDMKNSLTLLMSELDDITAQLEQEEQGRMAGLRYEATRINTAMMSMLALYKLENHQLAVHVDEVVVLDFVEQCVAEYLPLARTKNVSIEIECDDSLIWFFDSSLLAIVISNILGNSIRYTQSRILLSVSLQDGALLIQIDDDGAGYPAMMLDQASQSLDTVNLQTGSTGLGLYFAGNIAAEHQRQGAQGSISLENQQRLSGGCFKIRLP